MAKADKMVDMSFTTDPKLRKEQQLARYGAQRAEEAEREALRNIREDLETGRNLRPEDIRCLTRPHLRTAQGLLFFVRYIGRIMNIGFIFLRDGSF